MCVLNHLEHPCKHLTPQYAYCANAIDWGGFGDRKSPQPCPDLTIGDTFESSEPCQREGCAFADAPAGSWWCCECGVGLIEGVGWCYNCFHVCCKECVEFTNKKALKIVTKARFEKAKEEAEAAAAEKKRG